MDGSNSSIIPYLFLVTFILAIGIGIWQYRRARVAKKEHHTSADARAHGDEPGTVGGVHPTSSDRSSPR